MFLFFFLNNYTHILIGLKGSWYKGRLLFFFFFFFFGFGFSFGFVFFFVGLLFFQTTTEFI